jgi:uncharacterized protein YjbI with pentapeptide repeats
MKIQIRTVLGQLIIDGDFTSLADAITKHKANLFEANLSKANLFKANLSEANLSRANLFGANLSGANLSGANLSKANLSKANRRPGRGTGARIETRQAGS